jgi:Fur family iron response transcriptional regulator|tara:strand:+ start:178 stop:591 length:414 start_codon:yes stop_codon:yes gene_type:complete
MSLNTVDKNFLRENGLKPTAQRLAIYKILFSEGDKHFTAEEIKKLAISKGFKISVATIYNNLNHFVEAGLLKKRQVDNNRSYFDNNVSDHFHLFDEETNTLTDIPPSSVKFAKLPKLPKNKQIKNINLVINIKKNPV